MFLGRVKGSLVVNATLPAVSGKKLCVVEEVDARDLSKKGKYIITFDVIGTGEGELVLYEKGPEAAFALLPDKTGSDATILAIVDSIDL